ncbi:MAG: ATP-binding cassette domain-containing protein [Actinobacteria bacterium]|nr:ATP-binding cassette domain-containing protein [Actinomycetota bacterium]
MSRRRRRVLTDLTLRLGPGLTALVGPNGVGKTTLLRALASLGTIDAGSILLGVEGARTPSTSPRYRPRIGYLPQDPDFIPRFTTREALTYSAWLHRVDDAPAAVRQVIDDLALHDESGRQLRRLSGGTRRRVLLGQSLIHRPDLLLLDEPTVGMDAEHRHAFRRAVDEVAQDRIVVVSTHVLSDLGDRCGRVVVLGRSGLAFDGTVDELVAQGEAMDPANGDDGEPAADRAIRVLAAGR